jgi:zinc D-Ala-D-Ala carboxypeptidase
VQQLTAHFDSGEFETDGPMPPECIPVFLALCEKLLEPLRVHYNEPIIVTSGYRPPEANAEAHGVKNSQHIATAIYCAADWYLASLRSDMRPCFDVIRSNSQLEYDQLILEHGSNGDIIHSSWSRAFNRREALEGATQNQSAYQHWPSTAAQG